MQARMYLPAYGRFAQVDPAYQHSGDALNLYSYCSGNPVTSTDPYGMQVVDHSGGGSGRWHQLTLNKDPSSWGVELVNPVSCGFGSMGEIWAQFCDNVLAEEYAECARKALAMGESFTVNVLWASNSEGQQLWGPSSQTSTLSDGSTATATPLGNNTVLLEYTSVAQTNTSSKGPDFAAFDVSFKELPNVSFTVTLDRNGRIYIGASGGVGASATGLNGDLRLGTVKNSGPSDLRGFLSGTSTDSMVAPIIGYATTWNANRSSNEFVVGTPQASVGAGWSFSFNWMRIPGVHW
jgi:hypothetical protein